MMVFCDGLTQISWRLVYVIPMPDKVWISSQLSDCAEICPCYVSRACIMIYQKCLLNLLFYTFLNDKILIITYFIQYKTTCSNLLCINHHRSLFWGGQEDAFCDLSPPSLSFISDALFPTIMTPQH